MVYSYLITRNSPCTLSTSKPEFICFHMSNKTYNYQAHDKIPWWINSISQLKDRPADKKQMLTDIHLVNSEFLSHL